MPMTRMLLRELTPSILERSWFTIESETPVLSRVEPRDLQMASISSKMMTCRPEPSPISICSFSASLNSSRIFSSDPPTYLSSTSGPFTILGSRAFRILPMVRAIKVLPHPGGPYKSIPRTWLMPSCFTMCEGKTREAKARRKIWLNSFPSPPMPSLPKSKSGLMMLSRGAPECAPESATMAPLSLVKTTSVGCRSWPALGLPPPGTSRWKDSTVSSSTVPLNSQAKGWLACRTCDMYAALKAGTISSVESCTRFLALPLANRSTFTTAEVSAKPASHSNTSTFTRCVRVKTPKRRCRELSPMFPGAVARSGLFCLLWGGMDHTQNQLTDHSPYRTDRRAQSPAISMHANRWMEGKRTWR